MVPPPHYRMNTIHSFAQSSALVTVSPNWRITTQVSTSGRPPAALLQWLRAALGGEVMGGIRWVVTVCLLQSVIISSEGSEGSHSRKRRYVVFPEGSTLTVATSLQVAACVSPPALTGTGAIFTSGLAWALSYDLPNETIHTKDNRYEFPFIIRRHKRDLFVRMEKLMDSAGVDGKSCVLKTICETVQQVTPRQGVLEEILRLIFTYPFEDKAHHDWTSGKDYAQAHHAGESSENCNDIFPCPISLLQLGLGFGKYPQSYLP